MTKSFTKRLHRAIAVLMAVAMLVGTLPADMLGGIASVKAAGVGTTWSFSELTETIQGTTGTFGDIAVDASNTETQAKLFPHNGESGCCAQVNEGTILSVPVDGPCDITVTSHHGGNYANYTINGVAASTTETSSTVTYTGEAGTVDIVATATAYITSIALSEASASGDDASGSDASEGDVSEGDVSEGDVSEGDVSEGDVSEGDVSEGDVSEGDVSEGDVSEGDVSEGDVTSGDTVTIDLSKIDVWDFGAEQLDATKYNNMLNADVINSWYPGVEAGTKGVNIASFATDEIAFNDGGYPTTHRYRTKNTALTRYDEKSLTSADGSITYNGYIYSNKGATADVYLSINANAGDIITVYVASNGTDSQVVFENMSDATDKQSYVHTLGGSKVTEMKFYATQDATYKIYSATEKLVVARMTRQRCPEVTVTGTLSGDIPESDFSVAFTCVESGAVVEAPVSGTSYSATLRAGYNYELTLADANGYIITGDATLAIAADAENATKDITVKAVALVDVAGTITIDGEVNEEVLAAAEAFVLTPADENSIYVPEFTIDTATGIYSVSVESGVSYTLSVKGINDYEIKDNTWQFTENQADKAITITSKPTYTVTIAPRGAGLDDLANATFTFTNLGLRTGCEDDEGYTYTFEGPSDIKLRDGVYTVKVENASPYAQKLTSNVVVNGADMSKVINFEVATSLTWDFISEEYQGQNPYKGLSIEGNASRHGNTYGMQTKSSTISVPVSGNATIKVVVGYTWEVTFPGQEAIVQTSDGGNGVVLSYIYTGEAGTVDIVTGATATTYINKIEVGPAATEYVETVTVGEDKDYQTINDALDAINLMERTEEQRVTVMIDPGNYEEMLRVTADNITLKNASATPSIELKNKGVDIDENAVRITSYYGHGYTYYSMNNECFYDEELLAVNKENGYASFKNPGSGTTAGSYWNATVTINADGFEAEGIIFENSFNQYVSAKAANDVIEPQSGAKVPQDGTPREDLEEGSTEVQNKGYVERAAALAIYNGKEDNYFENCKFIGRQDTLYGGTDTVAAFYDCSIYGGTDFIMGPMRAVFAKCDLVMNTSEVSTDVAYITAAQTKSGHGMLMWNCHVTSTTPGVDTASEFTSKPGYFGRPWQAGTGEAVFYETVVDATCSEYFKNSPSLINAVGWDKSLSAESPLCVEYNTHEMAKDVENDKALDNSASRVSWAPVLTEPKLASGEDISVATFLGEWDPFAERNKDMTVVVPEDAGTVDNTPVAEEGTTFKQFTFDATTLTAAADKEAISSNTFFGEEDYFVSVTLEGGSGNVKRTSSSGTVSSVEIEKNELSYMGFTVRGTADVTMQVSSTGGTNTSTVALVKADGTVVPNAEGVTEVSTTSKTTLNYKDLPAGEYRLISPTSSYNRGFRLYTIVSEDTFVPEEPVVRCDWADVDAPVIGDVSVGDAEFIVEVEALIGTNGGDKLVVEMIDAKGEVAETQTIVQVNEPEDVSGSDAEETPIATAKFSPKASGSYTFIAYLSRGGEDAVKESKVSKAYSIVLPLATPEIKSITNKGTDADGKGSLEIAWSKVDEARSYVVTVTTEAVEVSGGDVSGSDVTGGDVSGSDASGNDVSGNGAAATAEAEADDAIVINTTSTSVLVTGLEVGHIANVSVVALDINGKASEAATGTATVKDLVERTWAFSTYGPSAGSTSKNNYQDVKVNEETGELESVTIWSKSNGGKIYPNGTDGLAYYYTTIDPTTENFTLTADVKVNNWSYTNGQEGFGLMVSDTVGEPGDSGNVWNNQYQAVATKIEYNWDVAKGEITTATADGSSILRYSMKLGLGWLSKEGITATDVAQMAEGTITKPAVFNYASGTFETSAVEAGKGAGTYNMIGNNSGTDADDVSNDIDGVPNLTNFKLQIQRNNDGYVLRYLSSDQVDENGDPLVLSEKLFRDENRNNLTLIDKKNIYVGFFTARNASATFSNIKLTTIHPDDDEAATEAEVTEVARDYRVLSSKTSNTDKYTLVFYGNADGKLTVLDNATGQVVVQDAEITAKKKYSVKTELTEGDNKFVLSFTPNADFVPGKNQVLDDMSTWTESHVVTYKSLADVTYVSNNGTANGTGAKESPLDLQTAVNYATAGQTIYLMEGTYTAQDVILIDVGHDGTAKEPIKLWADPEAATRPVLDFKNQSTATSAIILAGDYWYLKGFDVTNSKDGQKGLQVSGSYNVVEDVDTYRNGNTGIQVSRYLGTDSYVDWPSYNTILNCTSYLNADSGYEDADGFAAKLTVADGNKFIGCISAYNADDGWDLYAKVSSGAIGAVTLENCLAFKNGYMLGDNKGDEDKSNDVIDPYMDGATEFSAGNGNGFKMGGDSMSGHHVIKNSIAFANKAKGIDSNSCPDIEVYNCTSFDNESYNVALYTNNSAISTDYTVDGVLSLKKDAFVEVDGNQVLIGEQLKLQNAQSEAKVYSAKNFYFDGSKSVNKNNEEASLDWFVNTDTAAAIKGGITRDANGSIDMGGYLELKESEDIPAGVGAVLGNTSADVALETAAEVSVFASKVKVLSDINLAEVLPELAAEGYNWVHGDTAMAVYAGTTTEFIVEATNKPDKAVVVNLVEITGVNLYEANGQQYLFDNDNLMLQAEPILVPAVDLYDIMPGEGDTLNITISETSKLKLQYPAGGWSVPVTRTAESGTGVAKFTAKLEAKIGGKSVKKSATYEFTTRPEEAYINYTVDEEVMPTAVVTDMNTAPVLVAKAEGLGEDKTAVKVSVNDTKVVKYDAATGKLNPVGTGTATVTMTASADKKVVASFVVTVKGQPLMVNTSIITVDRAKLVGAQFNAIALYDESLVTDSIVVGKLMKGKTVIDSDMISVDHVVGNIYTITANEYVEVGANGKPVYERLATGTYTLTLKGQLASGDEYVDFEPVTLKVIETKPAAQIKWTKKVNLFYTAGSASNNGTLTATSKQAGVTLTQVDGYDSKGNVIPTAYKLSESKNGYNVVLQADKVDLAKTKKTIYAVASFDGYKSSYSKDVKINVSVETRKPSLKLELDNKVFYTALGIDETTFRIVDTKTKSYITPTDVALATGKAYDRANLNFKPIELVGTDYVLGIWEAKSGSAKISVQDADWTEPVIISQTISVNKSKPKATVGKLTLSNKFPGWEQTTAVITVKNALDFTIKNYELEGIGNAKALLEDEVLAWDIYVDDDGKTIMSMNFVGDVAVKKGSYSFKLHYDLNGIRDLTANVKLTVTDKVVATVKQSGKIDLVNRTGSSVTLKPSLKNLNGTVVGITLDEAASNLFDVEWNSAKGAAVVTAKEGIDLKKAGKYVVLPTFEVETYGGVVYVPVAKPINIVPTQSTLKTTKLETFETSLSAPDVSARATFKATSPAKAEILDMVQVNNLENFAVTYDCESDTIVVKMVNAAGLKANKTYKIKMELVTEGAAVNAKAQIVTVSVKVVK